jgi:hypothetical protein
VPRIREAIARAGERYRRNADAKALESHRRDLTGQRIFLRQEVLDNKLSPKFTGPYCFILHDIAKLTIIDARGRLVQVSEDRVAQEPAAVDATQGNYPDRDGERESVIDKIVSAHRDEKGLVWLRVRWVGEGSKDDSHEPETNLPSELVLQFYRSWLISCRASHLSNSTEDVRP